jgi:hypothetical protein
MYLYSKKQAVLVLFTLLEDWVPGFATIFIVNPKKKNNANKNIKV